MKNKTEERTVLDMFLKELNKRGFELSIGLVQSLKKMEKEKMIGFANECVNKVFDTDMKIQYTFVDELFDETFGGNK